MNLQEFTKLLKEKEFTRYIRAKDNFLSGWGEATGRDHIAIIVLKGNENIQAIKRELKNNNFSYIYDNVITDYGFIQITKNKSYTIYTTFRIAGVNNDYDAQFTNGELTIFSE